MNASPPVTTTYTIISSDNLGYADTLYHTIVVIPYPTFNIDTIISPTCLNHCYDGSIDISINSTISYSLNWMTRNNQLISNIDSIFNINSGSYSLNITNNQFRMFC